MNNNSAVPTTPTTDPRIDPFAGYKGKLAAGRWWAGVDNPCHSYMFRPDWDGKTDPTGVKAISTLPDSVEVP